jgi:hypothetical protein
MELQTPAPTKPPPFSTGCCPPFDAASWRDGRLTWHEKLFVKDRVRCVFHVPLNMGARILHNQHLIEAAKAATVHPLMLSDQRSPWATELYIEVTRPVPGAQMATLSGTFLTKMYEGPYRDAGKWVADMRSHVKEQQEHLENLYFAYTTCPRCAKAYGKNYVALFAKIRDTAQPRNAVA